MMEQKEAKNREPVARAFLMGVLAGVLLTGLILAPNIDRLKTQARMEHRAAVYYRRELETARQALVRLQSQPGKTPVLAPFQPPRMTRQQVQEAIKNLKEEIAQEKAGSLPR